MGRKRKPRLVGTECMDCREPLLYVDRAERGQVPTRCPICMASVVASEEMTFSTRIAEEVARLDLYLGRPPRHRVTADLRKTRASLDRLGQDLATAAWRR